MSPISHLQRHSEALATLRSSTSRHCRRCFAASLSPPVLRMSDPTPLTDLSDILADRSDGTTRRLKHGDASCTLKSREIQRRSETHPFSTNSLPKDSERARRKKRGPLLQRSGAGVSATVHRRPAQASRTLWTVQSWFVKHMRWSLRRASPLPRRARPVCTLYIVATHECRSDKWKHRKLYNLL